VIKGLIFDIRRFSVHDGPGIRTTVFLKGCPLSCWWCHNPESREPVPESFVRHMKLDDWPVSVGETAGTWMTPGEVVMETLKDRVFFDESHGGVTLSGGEPLFQPQFLLEVLKRLQAEGIHTAVDTCGYTGEEEFRSIIPYTDLFLFDLKHYDPEEHYRYTGVSLTPILQNLQILILSGKPVILRLPVIPGINDNPESVVNSLTNLIKSSERPLPLVHLLPYHVTARNKYQRFGKENHMKGIREMQKEDLTGMKEALEGAGFSVHIGG